MAGLSFWNEFISLFWILGSIGSEKTASRDTLYISGYYSSVSPQDSANTTGLGALPAVQLALEQINGNDELLPGYDVKITWGDYEVGDNRTV